MIILHQVMPGNLAMLMALMIMIQRTEVSVMANSTAVASRQPKQLLASPKQEGIYFGFPYYNMYVSRLPPFLLNLLSYPVNKTYTKKNKLTTTTSKQTCAQIGGYTCDKSYLFRGLCLLTKFSFSGTPFSSTYCSTLGNGLGVLYTGPFPSQFNLNVVIPTTFLAPDSVTLDWLTCFGVPLDATRASIAIANTPNGCSTVIYLKPLAAAFIFSGTPTNKATCEQLAAGAIPSSTICVANL